MKTTYAHYDSVKKLVEGSLITVCKDTTARHKPCEEGWTLLSVSRGTGLRVIQVTDGGQCGSPSVKCLLPTESGMETVTFFGDQFGELVIDPFVARHLIGIALTVEMLEEIS